MKKNEVGEKCTFIGMKRRRGGERGGGGGGGGARGGGLEVRGKGREEWLAAAKKRGKG